MRSPKTRSPASPAKSELFDVLPEFIVDGTSVATMTVAEPVTDLTLVEVTLRPEPVVAVERDHDPLTDQRGEAAAQDAEQMGTGR